MPKHLAVLSTLFSLLLLVISAGSASEATSGYPTIESALAAISSGDPNTFEEAVATFLYAAEEGDVDASYYLGVMHANGLGVEQDYAEAANWYADAVEKGHARACRSLAALYESGEGVKQNFDKAISLYKVATSHHPILQFLILRDMGGLYYGGSMFPGFTPAREANEAFKASGLKSMWDFYNKGEILSQDDSLLAKLVVAKADAGNELYQLVYAFYLQRGQGVSPNPAEALRYMSKAAENGQPTAQYYMATYYRWGEFGVNRDRDEFMRWSLKAAENGHPRSQNELAGVYEVWSTSSEPNYVLMHQYAKAASDSGDPYAKLTMAQLCLQGLEPGGMSQALLYFAESTELGYSAADSNRDGKLKVRAAYGKNLKEAIEEMELRTPYDFFLLEALYRYGGMGIEVDAEKANSFYKNGIDTLLSEKNIDKFGSMRSLDDEERERYDIAIAKWEEYGEKLPNSFYHIGQIYYHGRGLRKNMVKAREYFQKGDEAKDKLSCIWLGYFYQMGNEVIQNYALARQHYRDGLDWFDDYYDRILDRDNHPLVAEYWNSGDTDKNNPEDWVSLAFAHFMGDKSAPPDFAEAVRCLATAALMGNTAAQTTLAALLTRDSPLLTANYAVKLVFLHIAAENGHEIAQFKLGEELLKIGVNEQSEAEKWLVMAAEQGNVQAMVTLGRLYADGYRRPPDDKKGELWLKMAAEKKSSEANYWLGRMQERGGEADPDLVKAFSFYRAAYICDNTMLDAISRRLVYQPPKDDSFVNNKPYADKETTEKFKALIDRGNLDGLYLLAVMQESGTGVRQDRRAAMVTYEKAMERGDFDSQLVIAMDKHGLYGARYSTDYEEAAKLYQELLDEGYDDRRLFTNLGSLYQNGYGVQQDDRKAVELYRTGMEKGSITAAVNLGYMYANGQGVTKDRVKGVQLLKEGYKNRNADAMYNAGLVLERGDGIPKNELEALWCFEQAVRFGNRRAVEHLERLNVIRGRLEVRTEYTTNSPVPLDSDESR